MKCDDCSKKASAAQKLADNAYGIAAAACLLFGIPQLIVACELAVFNAWVRRKKRISDAEADCLDNCEPVSPLLIDLDGDGVEANALTHFDHAGDGWSELSYWADEDDGVLVWDKNGDGVINDGSELFGNNNILANGNTAEHGFAALSDLDSNGDGIINAADDNFADLRVMRWTDANGNDIKDAGEEYLITLDSLDIASLNTEFANSDYVDENGNEHRQVSSYTKTDGTTAAMTDVWFITNDGVTEYDRSGMPEHSETIAALPEIAGQGRMYSLRDAMALDAAGKLKTPFYGDTRTETRTLEALVAAFASADMANDKAGREELAEKILLRWAGAEGAVSRDYWGGANFHYTAPKKLAVVESFMGRQWRGGQEYRHPAYSTAQKINSSYLNHYENLYAELMLQTHLKNLNGAVSVSRKEGAAANSTEISDYEMDFSGALTIMRGENNARRAEFLRALAATYGDSEIVLKGLKNTAAEWLYEYEYNAEYFRDGVFEGIISRRNDYSGDQAGFGQRDVFHTTDGGADVLLGHGGDDIYHLGYGTGHDKIQELRRSKDTDDGDIIKIAPGIGADKVKLSRTRDDLIISLFNAGGDALDSLRVDNFYAFERAKIERVLFEDGTVWNAEDLQTVIFASGRGSAGSDSYDGSLDEVNRLLQGGGGGDIYWLGRGSGRDTVDEGAYNFGGGDDADIVRIKSGLTAADIQLSRTENNLIINVLAADGGIDGVLTIKNHYYNDLAKIEQIIFSDEIVWDADDFRAAVFSSGRGGAESDIYDGSLDGASGLLQGGKGGDVYLLGRGSGHDTVDESAYNIYGNTDTDIVRIKPGLAREDARLRRAGNDLIIEVLTADGLSADSSLAIRNYYSGNSAKIERVEFSDGTVLGASDFWAVPLLDSGAGKDTVTGLGGGIVDALDASSGGNDILRGLSGNDIYWFGRGSGNDTVEEGYRNFGDTGDIVRLKEGIAAASVSLSRTKFDLMFSLRDENGAVTDTLRIKNYYVSDAAKIERLELYDGSLVWDADDFAGVSWTAPVYGVGSEISGGAGNEYLYGLSEINDVFDTDAGGNDILYGRSGDDVYWLGRGTGHDIIREHSGNAGDAGDEIRVKTGITREQVDLYRSGNGVDLHVNLLDGSGLVTDSFKVENYYTDDSAKVERLHVGGEVLDANDFMIAEIRGGTGNEHLYGLSEINDVFDTDTGGNDILYGRSGDDVYWLGRGTGHDIIREYISNTGDAGDEIRVKSGITREQVDLYRSGDGVDLHVNLLDGSGLVTDSFKVENYYTDDSAKVERLHVGDEVLDANDFMIAEIRGGTGNEHLYGLSEINDVFDTDTGGNDILYGRSGDDVYWLGRGTGYDIIREYISNTGDAGDEIRVKTGITREQVDLYRSGNGVDLHVNLLDGSGLVTDSFKVEHYYTDDSAKVERLHVGGGVLDANDFMIAEIRGGTGNEHLYGLSEINDIFDTDTGGNDILYGRSGDDVYWLGRGTGYDIIREHSGNTGDAGDEIRVKTGITREQVDLYRSGDGVNLHVNLLDGSGLVTDSFRVENYYTDDSAKVERLHVGGGVLDANDFMVAEIRGGTGNDHLYGLSGMNDIFDTDSGGNDILYGRSGDDVYWLGRGTGHDIIREHSGNAGDAGDEIRVKTGITRAQVDLYRSGNGVDLHVNLLDGSGLVTDSFKVEHYYTDDSAKVERLHVGGDVLDANDFMIAEIRGGARSESLYGLYGLNDIFDTDLGGNDTLYGYSGDDVYWLGRGTGHDIIREHSGNTGDVGDEIRVKTGITREQVDLYRSGDGVNLHVNLLDGSGLVTDSFKVEHYYTDDSAKVERLHVGGGVLDANDFMIAEIRGGVRSESLYGLYGLNDIFDTDAGGNDTLYGYSGDDVYWLGRGTGHDIIREYSGNTGDAGDEIRIKTGIDISSVNIVRRGNDLHVNILDDNGVVGDSLRIENHFSDVSAKVESIHAGGKVLLESQFQLLVDAMAAFDASAPGASTESLLAGYWQDESTLAPSSA